MKSLHAEAAGVLLERLYPGASGRGEAVLDAQDPSFESKGHLLLEDAAFGAQPLGSLRADVSGRVEEAHWTVSAPRLKASGQGELRLTGEPALQGSVSLDGTQVPFLPLPIRVWARIAMTVPLRTPAEASGLSLIHI